MKKIRRCPTCKIEHSGAARELCPQGHSKFTLEEKCCGTDTKSVHPPHYNPHDKYAYIRRGEKSPQ